MRADAFRRVERRRVTSGDSELDRVLLGGWVLGSSALVWGDPGAGKTRLCLRWAAHAAPCLFVSLECPPELVLDTAASVGADLEGLWLVDTVEGLTSEAARIGARSVVVDSVTATPRPLGLVKELSLWAPSSGAVVWMVAHRNGKGRARGGPALEHWPDYTVRMSPRKASGAKVTVKKSRYCPRGWAVVGLTASRGALAGSAGQNAMTR